MPAVMRAPNVIMIVIDTYFFLLYYYWTLLICRNCRRRECIPRRGEWKSEIADEVQGNLKVYCIDPSQAACELSRSQHTVVKIYELRLQIECRGVSFISWSLTN